MDDNELQDFINRQRESRENIKNTFDMEEEKNPGMAEELAILRKRL